MSEQTIEKEVQGAAAPEQMSVEEMKKRREEINEYYKEEIPYLKVKADYEELVTRIEAARFERLGIQMQMAQVMAPPPEQQDQPKENSAPKAPPTSKKRTLKKQES